MDKKYSIDTLIESFEQRKSEMNLYHHGDQINAQKEGYELLSRMIDTDVSMYPLFKLICWIIPFKNSVPHIFTLVKYGRYAKRCILEIGSCHGASAIALGIGAKMYGVSSNSNIMDGGMGTGGGNGNNPKLITIDIAQTDSQAKGYFELFKEFLPSNRLVVRSDSKLFSFNEPIDLIYIDGSHKYEDVYADCNKYIPLVIKGGVCIFHDADTYDVSRAIKKFFEDNKDIIKYEKLRDGIIDSPTNSDDRYIYSNVGIVAIKII